MLLLLFSGGAVDLSGPITTAPAPGTGVVTQFPASAGAWRLSLEIAEPPGTTWYDITAFYVGDRYQRGADDYKGKYRASLVSVQLQVDAVVQDTFDVGPDILAPWGQDTTSLFGANVRIGAGLLMRLSMVREVDDVVVEWLPIWTGRVEQWGDASGARGQVRTHIVSVVDLLADLTNVPVSIVTPPTYWPEWFDDVLDGAAWPFGVDKYGDLTSGGLLNIDQMAAINAMDAGADPLGLVWRTLRSGRMVIHPAPWDTTHTNRYTNPLLDTYPDGLKFSYAPDFTDIEYIADDDQQPFGVTRSIVGILNSFVVSWPDGFDTFTYANDDPISTDRYGIRPFTASWFSPGNGEAVVDDLLADRAFSESQALPLRTTVDHEGFWPAMALVDHLDPVTVVHADSEDGLVVTGTGWIRNIIEERTVRDDGLVNWQSTVQIDLDSTETAEALLPVENLALVSTESPLLTTTSTATFSWTNPVQPSITPTDMQYRVLGRSLVWLPKSYPGVGSDGLVVYALEAATRYTFQVRLIRKVDGVVTNYSPWRQVTFQTPYRIYPIPVPDGTDTGGEFPGPSDDCGAFSVELQENDGTGWVTVDTFSGSELTDNGDGTYSLTTPIPNSSFNDGSMYRFVTLCDGDIVTVGPEFDPPDDWTDPCPAPPALLTTPFNDAIVYVPKICSGAEDGDPDFVFQGMQIIEAVSGIPGVPGDALDEIQTGLADPDEHVLKAIADPEWSDTPGIVAYGEAPTTAGVLHDKSIMCRVNIADDVDCVLFECAAMRITCTGVSGQWRPGVTIYKVGSTISLAGASLLNLDTSYTITATHDYETGDIKLYIGGVLDNSVGGTDNVATIAALPIWSASAPPSSWITDCAVWDRVLSAAEIPGTSITGPDDIPGLALWLDASDTATITASGGAVSQWNDKSGNSRNVTQGTAAAKPTTGTRTQNSLNVIDFDGNSDYMSRASFWYGLGTATVFIVMKPDGINAGGSGANNPVYEEFSGSFQPHYGIRYSSSACFFVQRTDAGVIKVNVSGADVENGSPHLVAATDSGTEVKLYVDNNAAVSSGAYTRAATTYNLFMVGKQTWDNGWHDGWIGEILIYDSVLSAPDLAAVKAYLQTKWGL